MCSNGSCLTFVQIVYEYGWIVLVQFRLLKSVQIVFVYLFKLCLFGLCLFGLCLDLFKFCLAKLCLNLFGLCLFWLFTFDQVLSSQVVFV